MSVYLFWVPQDLKCRFAEAEVAPVLDLANTNFLMSQGEGVVAVEHFERVVVEDDVEEVPAEHLDQEGEGRVVHPQEDVRKRRVRQVGREGYPGGNPRPRVSVTQCRESYLGDSASKY